MTRSTGVGRSGVTKPIPADFAQVAPGKTIHELCRIYGACTRTVKNWRDAHGIERSPRAGGRKMKAPPEGFAELAAEHGSKWLARHFNANQTTVRRWRVRLGIQPAMREDHKRVPADFATIAPTMHRVALVKHYGTTISVLTRWIEQSGVQPAKPPRAELARKAAQAKPRKRALPITRQPAQIAKNTSFIPRGMVNPVPPRDSTNEGEAADHLRARGWVVYRCDEAGRQTVEGAFWRVGVAVVGPDELLRRAEAKGWRAEAWAA